MVGGETEGVHGAGWIQGPWVPVVVLAVEESACNAGYLGLTPGLGRSPGEGNSFPLQCSGLENSYIVHGVAKSQTRLNDFHFTEH